MTKPISVSLARRFAYMAALLASIAMLAIAGASWWLINQVHAASLRSLLLKDAELQATTVSNHLREIADRMSELAKNHLIANALVDSAGKERYLIPFLSGIQHIHNIPVAILFTDFEGRTIARNGNANFSAQELNWLREKLPAGLPAARVQLGEKGEELLAVEFIVFSRSNTAEGAFLYRIKLNEIPLQKGVRLVRGPESEHLLHSSTSITATVSVPPIYKHLDFAVLTSSDHTARWVYWQPMWVFFILAIGMVVMVIILGVHFGKRLTRDLLTLESFARGIAEKGFGTGPQAGDLEVASLEVASLEVASLEVASLAQSINHMLEHLKQQHDRLNENEERWKFALEGAGDGVWDWNPQTDKAVRSKRWKEMLGYAENEFPDTGTAVIEHLHPDDKDRVLSVIQECFASDRALYVVEFRMRCKDGSWKWIMARGKLISRDGDGNPLRMIGTHTDISERKQVESELIKRHEKEQELHSKLQEAQNQLLQSEKMASIGQLAAGVAHEINNPIGYVYSNLGTLEKYVQDAFSMLDSYEQAEGAITDSVVRTHLQAEREKLDLAFLKQDLRALMSENKEGIIRVKNIVQNLKDFSHVDVSDEWHYVNLHQGLDSTLNIVNNEIKYKAEVIKEYGDIPEVECLASQLNQVFMNMLINAAHAIEERGTITIRTGIVRTGQQGEEVWVEIADSGKGIAPENLKKIFDPFFTTKPIGKGTGLGLSISYGIIQKHHGRIEVSSEVGKGTTFRVWLPVSHNLNSEDCL